MDKPFRHELEAKLPALAALCEMYGVESLDLFGSALTDDWNAEESDLDFLVEFRTDGEQSIADRYLALAEELESLFHRSIDLLTPGAVRNPYLQRSIDVTRARVYAA
jgi:predicted nucleotidyltransferase